MQPTLWSIAIFYNLQLQALLEEHSVTLLQSTSLFAIDRIADVLDQTSQMFAQMCFANLRNDNNLIAFNRKLVECDGDLRKWRAQLQKGGKLTKVQSLDGLALR